VQYGYVSDAAHTDGDMYVYFPQQNVLRGRRVCRAGLAGRGLHHRRMDRRLVGGLQRLQTLVNDADAHRPEPRPGAQAADLKDAAEMYGRSTSGSRRC
jgi:hypothetical protein